MRNVSVNSVLITPLKKIEVIGGDIMHGLKKTDNGFKDFGEIYFSIIKRDSIKAWKRHLQMTLNLVVPVGYVQFAFIDNNGNIREELVGQDRYVRLTIPPLIWFGFKGLYKYDSIVMNVADMVHNDSEVERRELKSFNFLWRKLR